MITRSYVHKIKQPRTYFNAIVIESFDTDSNIPIVIFQIDIHAANVRNPGLSWSNAICLFCQNMLYNFIQYSSRNASMRRHIANE